MCVTWDNTQDKDPTYASILQVDHPVPTPARIQLHGTVKCGCLATLEIKEAIAFPDFVLDPDDPLGNLDLTGRLRIAIQNNAMDGIRQEKRFYMRLPREHTHTGHAMGEVWHSHIVYSRALPR